MRIVIVIVASVLSAPGVWAQDASVCVLPDAVVLESACTDLAIGEMCLATGLPESTLRDGSSLATQDARVSLNAVETLTLGVGDVVRLGLPANLEDGLGVEAVLFGGMTVTNLVPVVGTLDAVTVDRARVRSTPDTANDSNIVDVLPAGTTVTAVGRNEGGDWLQIRYGEASFGWTANFLLRVSGDVQSLPVGRAEVPAFSPMQSITLALPTQVTACPDALPPGALLYAATPSSRLTINGANITFEGIVFAIPTQQVGRPAVRLELYSGRAVVQTQQGVQFLVPGSATVVIVSPDLTTPLDAPLDPVSTTAGLDVMLTPFATQLAQSEQSLALPVQGGQIEAQMLSLFAPDGLLPGQYRLTQLVVDAPVPLPDFDCALGSAAVAEGDWNELVVPQVGTVETFTPDLGDALRELYGVDIAPGVQVNGASLNDHNNPLYRTVPESNGENAVRTVVVNSLTSFTVIESWAVRAGDAAAACYNQFTWDWLAP